VPTSIQKPLWKNAPNFLSSARFGKISLSTEKFIFEVSLKTLGERIYMPPLINLYLTPDGSFYNFTSFISPESDNLIELSIGSDLEYFWDGKVNTLRFGGKYNNLKLGRKVGFSPFAYLNLNRDNLKNIPKEAEDFKQVLLKSMK